ncbi:MULTISPECIES: type II secretion system F family protein [Streptococcus]|jgi:general secretory pathway protein F, putative|uniref:Type II secretion system protein F n=2 Tax=Streptococcus sanguinis TaxID=1305 RepID=A0ABD7JPN1_STRSA|nr:type II secretion system F family protein [Streptococcus sanguinis]EGC21461.1 bacterial type II secretion system domain protein F [Streptococcus sanguinis SK353]MBZ2021216.1 type II secretion system F family protein [Streptococcus sanguinis]MBZ2069333.1 type II secretion system F family protein [Streptococcus sanguinis]MBZ2074038.1 type II secretion system F family protein [Streptococcus sanguinis]MBZ2082220.1 type II secretion system F family protein [Streptococcus sanguinis]
MTVYVCKYLDTRQGVVTLEVDAPNRTDAVNRIRLKGKPISVEEKVMGSKEITLFQSKKIKLKDISLFCKQMSVMLNSGIPLNNAVDILEQQTDAKNLKASLKVISKGLKEGNQLSKSLIEQNGLFPDLLIRMVQAGEKTGKLDEVLERMSEHYNKELKTSRQIRGAMIYPAVLAFLAVAATLVLLYVVIPNFSGIFEQSGVALPLPTRIVLAASNFVQSYWYILFGGVGLLVFLFLRYRSTEAGRYQLDQLKLKMPVVKGPMQKIVTARFASTLATLTSAGIPLVEAIDSAAATTNNAVVIDKLRIANEGLQKGERLTGMLTSTGLFPPMMLSMVKIGEESGSLESMLNKTSDFYEEELEAAIKQLLSLLEPAMIIVMGVIIGGIVASVMLPMFEIANAVQQGAEANQ